MGKRRQAKRQAKLELEELLEQNPEFRERFEKWHTPKPLSRRHLIEFVGFMVGHLMIFVTLGIVFDTFWIMPMQWVTQTVGFHVVGIAHARRLRAAGYEHLSAARWRKIEKWWVDSGAERKMQERQAVKMLKDLSKG